MQGHSADPFHYQRGQARFLALIAIGLFAALAYVITQAAPADRTANATAELRTPQALAAYPEAIQSTVDKMLADGVAVTQLDFQPAGEGANAVFSLTNGLVYRSPAAALGSKTEWSFKGISDDKRGFFIAGIGTDGPSGKDVIAYLDNVPRKFCADINEALGLPREPLAENPPVDLGGKGGGAKDKAGKNSFSFKAYMADPKPAACVQNGDKYVYYRVIVAK